MKSFSRRVLPLPLIACLLGSAQAQTVYRCGNSYGQSPCVNGVPVATDDPRSDAQRAAALKAQSRDKAIADEMEQSRRKDEADALARERLAMQRQLQEQRKLAARQAAAKKAAGSAKHQARKKEEKPFTVRIAPAK